MNESTTRVDNLLNSILDMACADDPDHANEFILALISQLAIWSIFYQANQIRQAIDKSFGSMDKKVTTNQIPGKPNIDEVLDDILRGKRKR